MKVVVAFVTRGHCVIRNALHAPGSSTGSGPSEDQQQGFFAPELEHGLTAVCYTFDEDGSSLRYPHHGHHPARRATCANLHYAG
jgi:hypothetical protein